MSAITLLNTNDAINDTFDFINTNFENLNDFIDEKIIKYFVAASDAPAEVKAMADYVCDGIADHVEIQAAINALPTNGGGVELSVGNFSASGGISWDKHSVTLRGQGVDATQITSTVATFDGVAVGTRQAGGLMRNSTRLEGFTYSHHGGASTKACIKIDGGGRGTVIRDVQTNEGAYGFQFIDLDRCYFENLDANNPRTASYSMEVGVENTYGTVQFTNCSASLSDASSIGFHFTNTAAQASPNRFDRIGLYNCLFFSTSGVAGTVGLKMTVGATAMVVQNSLFESNIKQIVLTGNTQLTLIADSFIQNSGLSTSLVEFNTNNHSLTVMDCRLQQATTGFASISGFPTITFLGRNTNQGNITSLFSGSFGIRQGNDTAFAGNGVLYLGTDNQRFENTFTNQLRVNNSKTPASASASGTVGDICWDANYMYVCVASNTWKRSPIATW